MTAGAVRVLVDATPLHDDSAYRGIGTYLRGLLGALAERADVELAALVARDVPLPDGVVPVRVHRHAPGRLTRAEHAALLPLNVRRAAARSRFDVVHCPGLIGPGRVPLPVVQTVHDLPALTAGPNADTRRLTRALRRADVLVAVSADTAADVARSFPSARVEVAPLGVAPQFRPAALEPTRGDGDCDGPPYLLFVGEYSPHKRHDLALSVHAAVLREVPGVLLRFVGRVASWHEQDWQRLRAMSPAPKLVEVLGYVDNGRLVELYQGAAAVLVLSEHEGFGLPALEAMACGAPVLAFDGGATREVVGDGGVVLAHGDVDGVIAAAVAVLRDPVHARRLRLAGLHRATRYTWAACAEAHVRAYHLGAGITAP